jgi:translation initiation factor eIF-2B subunit epsilon
MAPPKGGKGGAAGGEKLEARSVLQALLLADSFTQRFRPITVERPKALLPLANIPMIEYTLEWLSTNRVQEVRAGLNCVHQPRPPAAEFRCR